MGWGNREKMTLPGWGWVGVGVKGYRGRNRDGKQIGVLRPVNQCGYIRAKNRDGQSVYIYIYMDREGGEEIEGEIHRPKKQKR